MENTPTPHNSAKKGDIAKTVLMAGDPVRVKFIAEKYLQNAKLVNEVRGTFAYTGTYKGKEISVMAHGMGNPSIGIYSYELFAFYDVETIIRVGSIGAMQKNINIKDIIVCENAYTDTNYDGYYTKNGEGIIEANKMLVEKTKSKALQLSISGIHVGATLCADTYYSSQDQLEIANKHNLLGVEMESAALYLNAQRLNKKALTICTVSNSLLTNYETSSEERAKGFSQMVELALEVANEL